MGCGGSTIQGVALHNGSSPPHKVVPEPDGRATSSSNNGTGSGSLGGKLSWALPQALTPTSPASVASDWSRSEKQTKRILKRADSNVSVVAASQELPTREGAADEPTEEERKFLEKALQKHFIFGNMSEHDRNLMVNRMERVITTAGQVLFRQGDKGDRCFFVQSGVYTVSIDDRPLKQLRQRQAFGELALLYGMSRTGTVTCTQEGTLWSLDEYHFRECSKTVHWQQKSRIRSFLDSDQAFRNLPVRERETLAECCTMQMFQKGEQILREGEVGDWMFIIIEGNVQSVDQHGHTALKQPGSMLGAAGLMCTGRQLCGAKAIDQVCCLALARSALERLRGPVENVLRRQAIKSLLQDNAGTRGRGGELDFIGQLFDAQQTMLVDGFEDIAMPAGDAVVSVGAAPQFIVVVEGEVAVVVDKTVALSSGGALHLKDFAREVLKPGMTYGGRAVTEKTPMQEYAIALSPVRLYRITQQALQEAFGEPLAEVLRLNEIKKVLLDVFLFKNLHEEQMDRTIRALKRRRYAAGDVIVKQGDDAKHFFLIQGGTVKVSKDGAKLRTLGRWDYFGERGLLLQEKRSATCEAETSCICLSLEDETFRGIVGMFRRELEHRMYLQDLDITMQDLRVKAVVGRGTFGTVKLVCHQKDASKVYALKCVNKQQVVEQRQEKALVVERDIHAQCYHPCVVQFIKTFQDRENVYFLTEFLGGGDLFFVIREIGSLNKEQAQFYSGSIVLALEYLHGRSIMYRDLKPENVLLDFEGNAKLVDFGCCKKALRTTTLVGTPEYLAPEVILGKGYTLAVDWWALGVMLHEFVVGPLPFGKDTDDQLELFRQILEAPLSFPQYVSDESAVALITGLLERGPELRVGSTSRGAKEIQEHRYYHKFDWRALAGHYLAPPWVPKAERLQASWEDMHMAGPLVDEGAEAFDPSKKEVGMDWAAVF